jgi:hypothetical protein
MLSTKEKENLLAQAQEKKDKAKEKANE